MISIIFFFVNDDILFLFPFFSILSLSRFEFISIGCRQLFEIGIAYGRTEFWQYFDRLVTGQKSNLSNIETISEVSVSSFPNIELSWCSYHHDRFDSLKVMTFFIPPIFSLPFPSLFLKLYFRLRRISVLFDELGTEKRKPEIFDRDGNIDVSTRSLTTHKRLITPS